MECWSIVQVNLIFSGNSHGTHLYSCMIERETVGNLCEWKCLVKDKYAVTKAIGLNSNLDLRTNHCISTPPMFIIAIVYTLQTPCLLPLRTIISGSSPAASTRDKNKSHRLWSKAMMQFEEESGTHCKTVNAKLVCFQWSTFLTVFDKSTDRIDLFKYFLIQPHTYFDELILRVIGESLTTVQWLMFLSKREELSMSNKNDRIIYD